MAKAMLFTKKAPTTGGDNNEGKPVDDDETDSNDSPETGADDKDTVECPNCDCVFNDETMEVVKPGKPVAETPDDQGAELDISDFPDGDTKYGAAHDAAGGEEAVTQAVNTALRRGK